MHSVTDSFRDDRSERGDGDGPRGQGGRGGEGFVVHHFVHDRCDKEIRET